MSELNPYIMITSKLIIYGAALGLQLWRPAAHVVTDCEEDTWGVAAGRGEAPEHPYVATGLQESQCDFVYSDFDQTDRASVNWYASGKDFNEYRGVELLTKRHWETEQMSMQWNPEAYKTGLSPWAPGKNGPNIPGGKIMIGECEVPQADGGAWIVQRIGPLVSTGGYDFWQFGWKDVWQMSKVLKKHPEGVYFSGSLAAGVLNSTGEVLGFPPIHSHHIHICPGPATKTKMAESEGLLWTRLAVEQHGDYNCRAEDHGVECLLEKVPKGHMKEIRKTFDLEGEYNDARAPNSEPMTWWFTVALRWHPKTKPKPVASQMFVVHLGWENHSNQLDSLGPFYVPTHEDSLYWYTGDMWGDGEMLRNKLHSHTLAYDSAMWFRATPEELGLLGGEHNFTIPWEQNGDVWGYKALPLKSTGFASHQAFYDYLAGNLARAAGLHSRRCASFLEPGTGRACKDGAPELICSSHNQDADILDAATGKSYLYDRRPPTCCRPYKFRKGDVFTTIGFFKPLKRVAGPWVSSIPPEYPQHLHWVMTYAPPAGEHGDFGQASDNVPGGKQNVHQARTAAGLAEQRLVPGDRMPIFHKQRPPPGASAAVSLMAVAARTSGFRVPDPEYGRKLVPALEFGALALGVAAAAWAWGRQAGREQPPCPPCPAVGAPCLPNIVKRYVQQRRAD